MAVTRERINEKVEVAVDRTHIKEEGIPLLATPYSGIQYPKMTE